MLKVSSERWFQNTLSGPSLDGGVGGASARDTIGDYRLRQYSCSRFLVEVVEAVYKNSVIQPFQFGMAS